ncbi:hypothetical protein CK203_037385 [Vitis vinifera]|uniref:Polyvinylalcohol dehydrogenase n=1 Tax=Vitis vinifera TaxID=29760 RepID=A0A438HDU9_VITVI|nr:hypothetical protein CK203_037385 [Vitis vinifera]
MESSMLPLEFNGNTDWCIIQSTMSQFVQSNVSGAVDASPSRVSIHECFKTTSIGCIHNMEDIGVSGGDPCQTRPLPFLAGAAIWGSSPSIDVRRNLVYVATGNLYSAPLSIRECQEQQNNQTVPTQPDQCIEPDNHSNSILAIDLDSDKIKWYRQLGGYDAWFLAYIVIAVQKSGFVWALDRNNGSLIWATEAGPGGLSGGGTWGAATDGIKVYTNIVNSDSKNFTLKPSEKNTTAGGWVAMEAGTGKILWSTANPSMPPPMVQ